MRPQAKSARKAAAGHTKLHLGCGMITPTTWLNVDGSWNARMQRYPWAKAALVRLGVLPRPSADMPWTSNVVNYDLRKPLPWDDGQFEAVYASHLLEHLTWGDARRLLSEARRVLIPGGVCRIVVPDLHSLVEEYLAERMEPHKGFFPEDVLVTNADAFVLRLGFTSPLPRVSGLAIRLYDKLIDFHHHKWMYDERSLKAQMTAAGFVDVRRCEVNESRISNIGEVERASRVADAGLCCEGIAR